MVMVVLIFFIHKGCTHLVEGKIFSLSLATVLTLGFGLFILFIEKKEMKRLPVIGKWLS